jgi:hypothetical protein
MYALHIHIGHRLYKGINEQYFTCLEVHRWIPKGRISTVLSVIRTKT